MALAPVFPGAAGGPRGGVQQLDVHDAVAERGGTLDGAAVHPCPEPGGQFRGHRAGVLPGQHLRGLPDERRLIGRIQDPPGVVVHHHHVVADGQYDPAGPPAGPDVLLQQAELPPAAPAEQGLRHLVGGVLDQRHQQRVGVLAPAGQVDDADRLAGDGVVNGHPGAGQALQMLRVVLVAEDVRRPPGLQRGADAVGADEFLGVVEARRELDAVEMPFEIVIGGQPGQHEPVGVGEDDADRLPVELFVQVP